MGSAYPMRIQVMHAHNLAGAAQVVSLMGQRFIAHILPTCAIAPVLGAHTGPGLVGVCAAPLSVFAEIPGMV